MKIYFLQINSAIPRVFLGIPVSGLYSEWISYWLTGMGAQKNVPKKQKVG